ncbi:division/cell wall cluster transcriptional repressor MraZ [soil metagenome]
MKSNSSSKSRSTSRSASAARFRGRFEVKLDPKGRLSLPPALRISNQLVVTNHRVGGRNALHVYTLQEWEKLESRIARLPSLDAAVQTFERFYLSGGQVVELDGQGRMLLPSGLRRFALIESDAVLVGLGDKFEVWSQGLWETLFGEMTVDFDQTMARVASLTTNSDEGNET